MAEANGEVDLIGLAATIVDFSQQASHPHVDVAKATIHTTVGVCVGRLLGD